jgi:hypothetical protein
MTIPFGGLDLGTPDGLINGHTKGKCLRWQYMREPEPLKRVTFVRLQQRNASGIASRSTVAADKSLITRFDPLIGNSGRFSVSVPERYCRVDVAASPHSCGHIAFAWLWQ